MPIKVGTVCMGEYQLEWSPTPTDPYHYDTKPYPPIHHSEQIYIDSEVHSDPNDGWEESGFCPNPQPAKGDLVLCRVNAPLVQMAYSLIRDQVPVKIQGRDLGANLEQLITKLCPKPDTSIFDLITAVHAYQLREAQKLEAANTPGSDRLQAALQVLQDKVDCVDALTEGLTSVDQVLSRISVLFANVKKGESSAFVLLSSVHKAKGLESLIVRIIKPELLPHPMARTAVQKEQELNLTYVAYTRALDTLHIH